MRKIILFVCVLFMANVCLAGSSWRKSTWASNDEETNSIKPAPASDYRMPSLESRDRLLPFAPGTHNAGLDLGQVFLVGDLAKNCSDNIGLRLHYGYGVSTMFGFDGAIGYSEHGDGKFSVMIISSGLRFNLPWYDRVVPYAVVGLGFFKPSYRDTTSNADGKTPDAKFISPLLFGMHLGTGVDLQVNQNVYFGAALTFYNMFGVEKRYFDGTRLHAGGTFISLLLNAGVSFYTI